MTANTYKPGQITALYARLSQEDTLEGDSNSIVNQDGICQGYFHQMFPVPITLSEMMLIAATLEELLCIRLLRQIASVISHSLFPSSSHHYNPLCFVSFFQHNLFQPHPHLRFPHTKCLTSQGQKRPYFESWSAHTIWSRYAGLDMEEVRSLSPLLQTRSIVRTHLKNIPIDDTETQWRVDKTQRPSHFGYQEI